MPPAALAAARREQPPGHDAGEVVTIGGLIRVAVRHTAELRAMRAQATKHALP